MMLTALGRNITEARMNVLLEAHEYNITTIDGVGKGKTLVKPSNGKLGKFEFEGKR